MDVMQERMALVGELFGEGGIPQLWCPPLTHYGDDGSFDLERIGRHLEVMSGTVKGLLVPGSTGDGWELDDGRQEELLRFVLGEARRLGQKVLVGVLRTEVKAMVRVIEETRRWMDGDGLGDACCGFTVCGRAGEQLSEAEIEEGFVRVLDLGQPVAIYQLPQVTGNEFSGETAGRLAERYANFYLLKDTSGEDRVGLSRVDLGGVYMVRGAEGEYATWLKDVGGCYDGFLLSTANCFFGRYAEMIGMLEGGDVEGAQEVMKPVEVVVREAFNAVSGIRVGNAFTNANKAMDHFLAWGTRAKDVAGPMLCAGERLDEKVLEVVWASLMRNGLMVERGYME